MNAHPLGVAAPARSAIDDCWNKIGVRGDASCPALAKYVHCRNCPVYVAAAVQLLDRDPPARYLAEATEVYAQAPQVEGPETQSVFIFRIGAEWLALPTSVFEEIANPGTIHSLPHQRSSMVLGLVNIRGQLLICLSLAKLLGLEQAVGSHREGRHRVYQRLLVIRREASRAVVPVDEAHGLHRFPARGLEPVPATVSKATATHTKAMFSWEEQSVGLLDDELLFCALKRALA